MNQSRPTKRRRSLTALLGSAVAAVAMLAALAGPASAHHGDKHHGRHHHKHHKHRFDATRGPAGTVASFDKETGKLVIDLTGGDTVAGFVTEDTWLEFADHGGCDHGSSDDHGRRQLHGWDDHGWSHWGDSATIDDLVPGTKVESAILVVADGKATFLKVELAQPEAALTS